MQLEEDGAEGVEIETAAEAGEQGQDQAEANQAAAEEDGDPPAPPSVEDIASRMGWVPREKFRGDEAKWKPAEDYILAGRDIQDRTARELREVRTTLDTITKTTGSIMADKLREQEEQLRSRYNSAVEKGDADEALKIGEELSGVITARKTGGQPAAPAPETSDWIAKNGWYDQRSEAYDPVAAKRAVEVCNEYAAAGLPAAEQLKRTEAIVRREFPHLFPADDKAPAQVNGSGTRNTAAPAKKGATYSDLPKAAKDIADDLMDRGLIGDKESYARNYFAQAAKGQ